MTQLDRPQSVQKDLKLCRYLVTSRVLSVTGANSVADFFFFFYF